MTRDTVPLTPEERAQLINEIKQAAERDDVQKIGNLVKSDPNILNLPLNFGLQKILHIVAKNGGINLVQYLLEENKVDVNQLDNIGRTALHYAALSGKTNMVEYLLENYKYDVNKQDNFGSTALHFSAGMGKYDTVQSLVKNKADINKPDNSGKTALHYAAEKLKDFIYNNNIEIIKFLIREGGNPSTKDKNGQDVFDYISNQVIKNSLNKYYEEHQKSQANNNQQPIAATSSTQQATSSVQNDGQTNMASRLSDGSQPNNPEQKGTGRT